jgi:hypothetical protein
MSEEIPAAPPDELIDFSYDHLPEPLKTVSRKFCELAYDLHNQLPACRQRSMALEHLLIAKDAAVRASRRKSRK